MDYDSINPVIILVLIQQYHLNEKERWKSMQIRIDVSIYLSGY